MTLEPCYRTSTLRVKTIPSDKHRCWRQDMPYDITSYRRQEKKYNSRLLQLLIQKVLGKTNQRRLVYAKPETSIEDFVERTYFNKAMTPWNRCAQPFRCCPLHYIYFYELRQPVNATYLKFLHYFCSASTR